MRKTILTKLLAVFVCIFSLAGADLSAQQAAANMSVKSFKYLPTDNTANLEGTIVKDQNGDKCALIRVQTTETGFAFDCGQMKPCKIEYKVGEIWVYVPYGVKRMTIRHPKLGTLADYSFPVPVEKARTYNMELVTAQIVTTVVAPLVTSQYVVFTVSPENAQIELDGEMLMPRNGSVSKLVKMGTHKYKVMKKNYHDFVGTVDVNDTENSVPVKVTLKPAFGHIKISDQLADAVVFIDGEEVKLVPSTSHQLSSGNHRLMISKPMYEPLTMDATICDGQTFILSPSLKPNFKRITISSVAGAEIWINGKKVGSETWTGNIEKGPCRIEIKKDGHRTVTMEKDIDPNMTESLFVPTAPTPIYGALQIEADPAGTTVVLDGKEIGKSPLIRAKILVGRHKVRLYAEGYEAIDKELLVEEGKICQFSPGLSAIIADSTVVVDSAVVAYSFFDDNGAVDLGLSVKWASCNIGASRPEKPGLFFAWGDVKGQTWDGSKWSGTGFYSSPSRRVNSKKNLPPEYDAAHVILGGKWRMPTRSEMAELIDNCTCTWTNIRGIWGWMLVSKRNRNAIFLPASGYGEDNRFCAHNTGGKFWSGTCVSDTTAGNLYFFSDSITPSNYYFNYGMSIRPVCE